MVLILDGDSKIVAHKRSDLCNLISLRHLIKSSTVTNCLFFSEKKTFFFNACVTSSELPSYASTMVDTVF